MTITVKAYRLDTGAHSPHLDAVFASEAYGDWQSGLDGSEEY